MDRLVSGIEDSEAAMVGAIEGVRVAIGEDGDTDERSAETDAELQRIAAAARTDIAAAGEDVAAVAIQPWHEDVVAARDAYLDHSGAWQDFLAAASDDAEAWFVEFPAIETTWQAFGPLVEAAVPSPALRNLQDRVALILADGDGPEGGPTLAAAG